MLKFLTPAERNTYASANALALLTAVIVINGLPVTGSNLAIILILAVIAGCASPDGRGRSAASSTRKPVDRPADRAVHRVISAN
jgi:hypothetical protein